MARSLLSNKAMVLPRWSVWRGAPSVPGFIGGLELGSRYLLPAAPLLLIGAADHLRRQTPGLQRGLTAAIQSA